MQDKISACVLLQENNHLGNKTKQMGTFYYAAVLVFAIDKFFPEVIQSHEFKREIFTCIYSEGFL